jgi:hypothetical protein
MSLVSRWSYLEVNTSSRYARRAQAYAAGVAEAMVTHELIRAHVHNTYVWDCVSPSTVDMHMYCMRLKEYLQARHMLHSTKCSSGEYGIHAAANRCAR